MRFSINCSAVICSPTVIHAISREATSETYVPWVSFLLYRISFTILQSLLSNLYQKNTKNIYLIISVRSHFCKSLRIIRLVWPTRLIFLAMGEVLSFGFNLAVSFPSNSRGSKARIVLLPSRIKIWGLYHIA